MTKITTLITLLSLTLGLQAQSVPYRVKFYIVSFENHTDCDIFNSDPSFSITPEYNGSMLTTTRFDTGSGSLPCGTITTMTNSPSHILNLASDKTLYLNIESWEDDCGAENHYDPSCDDDYATARLAVDYTNYVSGHIFTHRQTNGDIFKYKVEYEYNGTVIYVDKDATGKNEGSSWENAFTKLEDALKLNNGLARQVRVAEGIYRTSSGFSMPSAWEILGGFSGPSNLWNPKAYLTLLSGDKDGDDLADGTIVGSNATSVVLFLNVVNTTILKDFTIQGGNGNIGGGIRCLALNAGCSPQVNNCVIRNNKAYQGAGVGLEHNNVISTPKFENCFFINNRATYGGGLYSSEETSLSSQIGGVSATNCVWYNNQADAQGGSIYVSSYRQNAASFQHNIFYNNTAFSGKSIYQDVNTYKGIVVKNSVLWGGTGQITATGNSIDITYSDIEGGYNGTRNINSNPLFANVLTPAGTDNIWGTADDGFTTQDNSPLINNGTNIDGLEFDILDNAYRDKPDMGAFENQTFCGIPTDANGIAVENLTPNGVFLSWNNGNGSRRLVVMKTNAPFDATVPSDNFSYTANNTFGSGGALGGGYVVYNGTGNTMQVWGLNPGTRYYIAIFEYNSSVCGNKYKNGSPATAFITPSVGLEKAFNSTLTATGTSTNSPSGQEPNKALDNNISTKYLNFDKLNTGLMVDLGVAKKGIRLSLTTANDAPERDPSSFILSGSNNNSTFTTLATSNIPCINGRGVKRYFEFDNTTAYRYYKIIFPTVCDASNANSMQIADVQLELACEFSTRFYVAPTANGTGDGSSWANATNNLQSVLNNGCNIKEVWVKAGVFKPTTTTNRDITFVIESGFKVYGSFAGTENNLTERTAAVMAANPTILSGDIGVQNDTADNSKLIVSISDADNTTRIDGFTITKGNNNHLSKGAGLSNYANFGKTSYPTIANCIFSENYASHGSAINNDGEKADASPKIINCQFLNNGTHIARGVIYNNGYYGVSSPTITNCTFSNNKGVTGSAIYNLGQSGISSPTIDSCTFTNNFAVSLGSCMFNHGLRGLTSPIISNSVFTSNTAAFGAAIYNYGTSGDASPTITNCTFASNGSATTSSVIYNDGVEGFSSPTIKNSRFSNNTGTFGGVIRNSGNLGVCSPTIIGCSFLNNTAIVGGAIYNQLQDGGEIKPVLKNCVFASNSAQYGGAITSYAAKGVCQVPLTNCTFYNNSASVNGQSIIVEYGTSNSDNFHTLTNCIIWQNNSYTGSNGLSDIFGAFVLNHCIVQNLTANATASNLRMTNCSDNDPSFINSNDPDGVDNIGGTADDGLQLQAASLAIDEGTNTDAPTTDLLGVAIYNTTKDIGAYETPSVQPIYANTADCQSVSRTRVSGHKWYYFRHLNGIVAAINPNGMDLGTVTAEVSDPQSPVTINGSRFLSKTVNFTSSRYAEGATMPANYSLRLYHYDSELAEYNSTVGSNSALTDLNMAWFQGGTGCNLASFGGNLSGVVMKNNLSSDKYGVSDNGFYLQLSLNHFTIFASTHNTSVLPVELLGFNGKNIELKNPTTGTSEFVNWLTWTTAHESRNKGFHIERQNPSGTWENIGFVTAKGSHSSYEFMDKAPLSISVYRLRQVDFDGKEMFSKVISINKKVPKTLKIYPSVTTQFLTLDATEVVDYQVFNLLGQPILNGRTKQRIDVSDLPTGTYIIRVGWEQVKFVKQ
jgi:hypothetical protein